MDSAGCLPEQGLSVDFTPKIRLKTSKVLLSLLLTRVNGSQIGQFRRFIVLQVINPLHQLMHMFGKPITYVTTHWHYLT